MNDFNLKHHDVTVTETVKVPNEITVGTEETNEDPVLRAKGLLVLHEAGMSINFELTKELALECVNEILEHFLPDGEQRGHQYVALNPTRNDSTLGSFQVNMDSGLWTDFADDATGGDLISLISYITASENQRTGAIQILKFIAGQSVEDIAQVSQRKLAKNIAPDVIFTPIMPVPAESLVCRATRLRIGDEFIEPSASWEYRNLAGQLMFFVHRLELVTGKQFRPQTFCKDSNGSEKWRLSAPPAPRTAYGLEKLAARPDAPVLFTEGEKAADAAQRLLPEYVAVTTMNGAQSPEKTDFTPFMGRKIYIAPDNDEAGTGYKDKLIRLLGDAGAEVVAVMRQDLLARDGAALSKGYDLADAEVDGWTAERFAKLGDSLWESVGRMDPLPPASPSKPNSSQRKERLPEKKESLLEKTHRFSNETFDGKIAFAHNQFRAYSSGYWPELDQKVDVERAVLEFLGYEATPSGISSITSLLGTANAVKPTNFERHTPLICLQNGTLNPLTGELSAHTPDHYLTNKLNIDWSRDAACPIWLQTLDEIFSPDADRAEKVRLLQEFMGYCLVPMTHMHKFLWMVGSGGNGKSLILATLTALIGSANISFAQIERLQEKFVRAELCGKLINISSEMSAQATIADGYLKQIVSGDVIEAERKHQPSFSFKPYCRMIGATNELPRLLDSSDGFFRRAMILTFNRQFSETEQDKNRETKLMSELPGILKWAVEGLQALLARTHFAIPVSSAVEVNKYRVNSDPIRQFVEECIKVSENRTHYVTPIKLHGYYQDWNKAYGYQSVGVSKLTERLKGLGFDQYRSGGARLWKIQYSAPVAEDWGDKSEPKSTSPLATKYSV